MQTASGQTQLFTNGSNPTTYYRIPSIVRLKDGRLWAFSDKRFDNANDIGRGDDREHRIDIAGRIGTLNNNTYTWEAETTVLAGDDKATEDYRYAYGDAAAVVDRESGKVLIMAAAGKHGVNSKTIGYPLVARSVFSDNVWTSTNVTNQFYGDNNLYGSHIFVSSGRIIQSTIYKKKDYYRIYAGVCTMGDKGSRVAYSDDFGETWHYLGGYNATPVASLGDECKVEELPDGSILLNTRTRAAKNGTGRHFNIFKFTDIANGKGTWQSQYVTSGASNTAGETYAAANNGEILLVPAKRVDNNVQTYVLLLSAPASNDRSKVCIYWKELPAIYSNVNNYITGWSKYTVDNDKYYGYSTMVLDKNGDIALLVEMSPWVGPLTFKTISLADITENKYTYSPSASGTYHTTGEPTFEHGVGGVVKPTLSVYGGTFTASQTITLNAPEETKIFYTLDGSDPQPFVASQAKAAAPSRAATPSTSTQLYSTPITISEGVTTLKALAVDDNGNKSQTVATTYRVAAKTDDNTTTTDNTNKSKTGTMITLDHGSSEALYTTNGINYQWFAFLRHKATHFQLMVSSKSDLKPGEPLFATAQNNMLWKGNDKDGWQLELNNGQIYKQKWVRYQYSHYAILAPKGYRILSYEIKLAPGSAEGVKLEEYTYKEGSNTEVQLVGNTASVTASNTSEVTLARILDKPTNVLYFRQDALDDQAMRSIYAKSIKLIYAIDNAFEEQMPNENGTSFHSGFVDFGKWGKPTTAGNNYGFTAEAPTDKENVNVKMLDGSTPQTVTVDGNKYFLAATNGDYYLEAPKNVRIVGATFNIHRATVISTQNYTPSNKASNDVIFFKSKDGTKYLSIKDGNGIVETDSAKATQFTITYSSQGYTIMANGKYMYMEKDKPNVRMSSEAKYWSLNGANELQYNVTGKGNKWLVYSPNNSIWGWGSYNTDNARLMQVSTFPASNFTAKVFNPEDTGETTDGIKEMKETSDASVTVNNLNNDAVHINIKYDDDKDSGAALFNVKLKMIALNPEVETVEAAALPNGTGEATGNSPVTSENFIFNHGNTINVPVADGTTTATMVFRNAKNEEVTNWYKTGYNENGANETGSYSNVYLIGSTADSKNGLTLSSPVTGARTAVDMIGTTKIDATNISYVADRNKTEDKTLQDNKVDAGTAGYQTVTMKVGDTKEPNTYYLYSADKPTNEIMPPNLTVGQHVDFRFYSIKVKPVVAEKPKIEIVPLYSSTMKGEQHKKSVTQSDGTKTGIASDGSSLNTTDKYVGIKVTAQLNDGVPSGTVTGYLTAEAIEKAMKTELGKSAYKSPHANDPLRNVLYVDMSDLKTVTTGSASTMEEYGNATADNCLFFMPQGFAATNMPNTIAKQTDGTYKAIGDITVYDQQPFFSPYDFTTGQFKASYTREATVNAEVAQVRNMAVVLPFDITLDPEGHPYLSGETKATTHITFSNIIGSGIRTAYDKNDRNHDYAFAVVPEKVTTQKAEANQPYYVEIEKGKPLGFQFFIPNASFKATPAVPNDKENANQKAANPDNLQYKKDSGTWTAHGTYNGVAPAVDAKLWYFSKDYFWKSSQIAPKYTVVNVRPFRAYFTTTDQTGNYAKAGVVYSLDDIITTGIGVVNVTPENGKVYTLDGRYVGNSLENLPPNIYIQNGRKIIKR